MNNPTIVSAALSDKELQDSINKMVANFDKGLQDMLDHSNKYVEKIQESLQKIGNTDFGAKGSNDGGVVKQTKAQNDFTDAVKKSTDEIKNQGKQGEMSLDQIQGALQMAMREVRKWESHKTFSTQDLDKYQASLARVVELNEKLKRAKGGETYTRFDELSKRTAFDAKATIRDLTAVDDRLKQLNNEYKKLEAESKKAFGQDLKDAFKLPTTSLDEVTKKILRLKELAYRGQDQGFISQSQIKNIDNAVIKLRELQREMESKLVPLSFTKQTEMENKALQEQKEHLERIKSIAKEVKEDIGRSGFAQITNYKGVVYAENDARSKGLTIEQQIEKIIQEENAARNARLSTEKQITQEVEKQKKEYVAPSSYKSLVVPSMLRPFVEEKLGLGFGGAITSDATSKIKTINAEIKQLNETWQKMSDWERKSPFGDTLRQRMQMLQRQSQQLNQQLSRPVSLKDALSGSEKTLDDIAYKMQRLRAYKQVIDLTKPNAANEIKQVDDALARLQKDADKWMSKSQQMIKSNTALGRSWNYMKNRLAFYVTVGAGTSFIKQLIDIRSQYEMNERALGILIDSAERGTQIFNELSQMALVSPYTLIELSSAAKQLTAYDVAAKDVVDTTRRLADMAAAVGIPIERLTYALGQIKAYGYLNNRDARMFANAGIPLVKQLSDYYTELEGKLVSTADVYDRIKKKAIDYNEVMEVMYKMTDKGGKFFDFQAKMADTLKVRLANLTLAWNNMLNDMGKETQGVLTWGIGALRDLFLQWKQLHNLIENAALAVGIRTLLVALRAATIGLGSFGKAMTWNAILGKKLGGVVVGLAKSFGTLFSSRLTWFALLAIAAVEATQAIFGVNEAQKALNESIRNGAKDNYDNISKFLEQYKEIRDSLYSTQKVAIGSIYNPTTRKAEATSYAEQQVGQDIDKNEAKKAWEAVREQIELTVVSSDKYIGNLLSISNMSERVRQGFNLLDDVQVVNAALKELDDDTIKVSKNLSAWWNAWQAPDGLIGNLKDYQEALNDIIAKYGTLESFRENTFLGGKGSDDLNDYETALERFRNDLQETTDSIINFIELKGWSGDESKINQVFEQITQKLVLDNQLDPQKAFTLQTEVEEARSKAAKQALLQRINDEKAALKVSYNQDIAESLKKDIDEYKHWDDFNGRKKVEWERFTKWLKEQHISETTAMFRNMDDEDIKSLNFQEGKHAEWVTRMVTQYAKEHKMSYDEAFDYLKSWVRSANQWSVFIPLIISTEDKKSVYDQLGEYDKAVDEADAQIARLTTRINELNAKKKKSKEETQELANAEQELADAQKAKSDAESKGGHGKKEKKDEKAANKAAKQAESELQKALKDELSTIEKVRSIYKDLVKDGASHANAVARATSGWNETVNAINRVLQKNGLQKLDLSKFAGIENPRELLNILQSQLETLVKRGASTSEIRVLQTKIQTVSVEADKYDLTMITKGLNSELDRLKEEYELAVELDANPEMGNLFADWMGFDMSALPHTAEEYAKRMTKALNKYLADEKSGIEIGDLLALTDDDLRMFQQRVDNKELTQVWVDNIVKNTKEAHNALKKENSDIAKDWDSLIQKYAEYEYKIAQVQRNANKERKAFALKYGTNDQKERALVLTAEIDAEEDQAKKQKLINQLKQLLTEIAGDDDSKLKIPATIDKKELEEGAKVSFEEFQKSPEWIVATGDLAGMTNKAIGGLINSIESYKKKAKNLDPKQIKNINNALRKLYKQQREGNPFLAISNSIDQAKARMEDIQPALDSTMSDIIKLEKEIGDTEPTEEQAKALDKLKKKWKELYEVGQLSASDIVSGINSAIDVAVKASESFNKMAEALGGTNMTKAAKTISDITGNLQAAGQGAAAGAQLGGGWGAAIGATAGGLTDLVTRFAEQWSGNKSQTERVKEVEESVGELELAYIDLEHAVDKAMGTAVIGAKHAALANKQAQLESIKRQLELEKERDSKYRDSEKILSLEKQYKELFNEIQDGYTELVDTIMGTDVSSFAENLVSSMITAFKQGEDYMKVFNDKFDEMIDNMIMKSIVSRVVASYLNKIWDAVDERINNRAKEERDAYKKAQAFSANTDVLSDDERRWNLAWDRAHEKRGNDASLWDAKREYDSITEDDIKKYVEAIKAEEKAAKARLEAATELTDSDIDFVLSEINETMPELGEKLKAILGQYYKFGESSDKNLSALQQGLQSMSEDTGSALESYMNGVSQQVYYHSSLLEQIRDSVAGLDLDVSLGVQSQMLLQLQNSYQTQQAIQQILEGVLVPSGRAFAVELLS